MNKYLRYIAVCLMVLGNVNLHAHVENEITYVFDAEKLTIHCTPRTIYDLFIHEYGIEIDQYSSFKDYHQEISDYFIQGIDVSAGDERIELSNMELKFGGHDAIIEFDINSFDHDDETVIVSIQCFLSVYHRPKNFVVWNLSDSEIQFVLSKDQTKYTIVGVKGKHEFFTGTVLPVLFIILSLIVIFVISNFIRKRIHTTSS